MANIKELIESIESTDSSFDDKLEAITKMEETLVAMRQQEEEAINDNVELIVEAIKVMENKVSAQLEIAKSIVPEKGDKGDKGADGKQGKDGRDGKDGKDGLNGKDGQDGQDGVSVTDAKIDFDGSLVITLSTGQELNVGEVVAPELQERIKLVTSGGAGTVLPDQTGNANKYLKTDGSVLSWSTVSGGSMVYPSGTGIAVVTSGTSWGTTLTAPSGTIVGTTDTQTLTNKRIDPRVTSAASASSLTPDISASDVYAYTALAAGLTINAPTGTPLDGDKLIFRLLDNGTSRSLTWNGTYTVIGVTLPTATTISKTTYVGCIYNANNTRWDVIAVTTQA